jgi:phospholipid/cholesterol/gamma-HCH transport system substrate-binding protein
MGREIRLGIFFFAMLIVLGFVTLTVSQWTPPWAKRYTLKVYFPSADGLKRGDQVRIVGVPYGRVESVKYNRAERKVEVGISVDHGIEFREGYAITIQESALVGGRYIEIFPGGDTAKPLDGAELLKGSTLPSPMQEISKMVQENRENVRETLQDLREVARTIREGPGALHDLVTNKEVFGKVEKAVEQFEKFGEKLNAGEGTFAKLINKSELYDNLSTVSADLKEVSAQIRQGPGTVHDLLYDPELSKDLRTAIEDVRGAAAALRDILEKVQTGEKPLLAYAVDEQTYSKAEQAIQDAAKVIGRAARIEVSLGGGAMWYPDTGETISSLFLRLAPGEEKYFQAGGSFLSLDPHGDVDFEEKLLNDSGDLLIKLDAQLAYRLDFLADWLKPFWLRGGLIEGKPGGAIDARWKDVSWLLGADVDVTYLVRDAYASVEHEDLDEQIHGPMMRLYGTVGVWKGFKFYGGLSRIGAHNSLDWMAGASYEFSDDDLRSVIALIGLAN